MTSLLPSLLRDTGDPFRSIQKEIDRVFESFSGAMPDTVRAFAGGRFPAVDVAETGEAIGVTAELPGMIEADIDVSIADRAATIQGEKVTESESEEKEFHVVERASGKFRRTIPLAFVPDPDQVEAVFENGVLTLHIPKPPEQAAQPRKIAVNAAK